MSTSIAAPTPIRPLASIPSQTSTYQTLIAILRRANAYYAQLAAIMRASRRSTGHARKRAAKLGLTVDIENARNLDHKQVSVIPLPVLDIAPSPIAPRQRSHVVAEAKRSTTRPALRCSIPQDVVIREESSALSAVSVYSTVPLDTPEVIVRSQETIAAPRVLRGQNVPWRPVTSRWSMSTADEQEVDVVYSSDYDEGMDLPNSAADDDGLFEEKPVVDARSDTRLAPRLDIPVDVSRLSWGSVLTSDYASSSSSSSPGPATPPEALMIRIKRKSVASDFDMLDETLEKRPKYERKSWANAKRSTQRTTTTSAPRKF